MKDPVWKLYTPTKPPTKSLKIPDREWTLHKDLILKLYLDENLKLKDVQTKMIKETGFHASLASYKHRLKVWNVHDEIRTKNFKMDPSQKRKLARLIFQRQRAGKPFEIWSRGGKKVEKVEQCRMMRALKRLKLDRSEFEGDAADTNDESESSRPMSPAPFTISSPNPEPITSQKEATEFGLDDPGTFQDVMKMDVGHEICCPVKESAVKQFTCRIGDIKIATIAVHTNLNREDLKRFLTRRGRSRYTSGLRQFFEIRNTRKRRRSESKSLVTFPSPDATKRFNWNEYSPRHPTKEECVAISVEASELLQFLSSIFKDENISIDLDWAFKSDKQLSDEHLITWMQLQATRKVTEGRYSAAIEDFKDVLRLQESHVDIGRDHPDTVFQLKAIAALYALTKNSTEAIHWYRRTLELQIKHQGSYHFDTIHTIGNLLYSLVVSGASDDTLIPELERLLSSCEQVLLHDWDRRKTRCVLRALRRSCRNLWTLKCRVSKPVEHGSVPAPSLYDLESVTPAFARRRSTAKNLKTPCLKDVFFKWCDRVLPKLTDRRRTYMAPCEHLDLFVTKAVVLQDLREEFLRLRSSPRVCDDFQGPKPFGLRQYSSIENVAYQTNTAEDAHKNNGSILGDGESSDVLVSGPPPFIISFFSSEHPWNGPPFPDSLEQHPLTGSLFEEFNRSNVEPQKEDKAKEGDESEHVAGGEKTPTGKI